MGMVKRALRGVYRVLVDGKEPQRSFSSGDNITLVFFAHGYPEPIYIRQILRKSNEVAIDYQIGTPASYSWSSKCQAHVALIPVSSIQSKELSVSVNRLASENTEIERHLQNPIRPIDAIGYYISGPFRIDVQSNENGR